MNKVIALFLVVCSNCFSMQHSNFRDERITYSAYQATLTLQNHQCEVGNFYIGDNNSMQVPQTPLAHSYNGYEAMVTFSANIKDNHLQARIAQILGVDPLAAPYCALTVMNYLINGNEMCAYKPQHAFSGAYVGGDTWALVAAQCKVYTAGGGAGDFNWGGCCKVNFHPDNGGKTLISGNTHHLGFTKDGKTRIVLHNSQYLQGQLERQSRIGMIVLCGDDDAGKGIFRTLNAGRSFADTWCKIEQYLPEFSAALQLPGRIQQDMPVAAYAPTTQLPDHTTDPQSQQIDEKQEAILLQLRKIDEGQRTRLPQEHYALLHDAIESLMAFVLHGDTNSANFFTEKLSVLRQSNWCEASVINAIIDERFKCK